MLYIARAGMVVVGMIVGAAWVSEGVAQLADGYRPDPGWAKLPEGRQWGAVSGVWPDPDGEHMWVLDRCGEDSCLGSDLHPIFKFDLDGNVVANFGAGIIPWPHGFFVDANGNVWVADGATGVRVEAAEREGKGHQVFKFSPDGELLMTLGTAGQPGKGPNSFEGPSAVIVAPDGSIFIADGHGTEGNNRIVKFTPDGELIKEWGRGGMGPDPGEFNDAHAFAFDSEGRLFIGDRRNHRLTIFTQEGEFLQQWTHLGAPSGLFIDENDVLFALDTQSGPQPDWVAARNDRDPSVGRGIWVADATTGEIRDFIPSDAEFVAVDRLGNVYGAEIQNRNLVRWVPVQ